MNLHKNSGKESQRQPKIESLKALHTHTQLLQVMTKVCGSCIWLVVWNMICVFQIGNVIIPIDALIFVRVIETTNQWVDLRENLNRKPSIFP